MGWSFCLGAGCGCTFDLAENYDPNATVDDGSCIIAPGTDCTGLGDEYAGMVAGCGGVHCYSLEEIAADAGNGSCNAHGAECLDDPYGWCHGLACEYFDCDGGDCSQSDDPDSPWGCYEAPATCDGLTVNMFDAYGDGWNGNTLTIGDQGFTIESGTEAVGCYTCLLYTSPSPRDAQ